MGAERWTFQATKKPTQKKVGSWKFGELMWVVHFLKYVSKTWNWWILLGFMETKWEEFYLVKHRQPSWETGDFTTWLFCAWNNPNTKHVICLINKQILSHRLVEWKHGKPWEILFHKLYNILTKKSDISNCVPPCPTIFHQTMLGFSVDWPKPMTKIFGSAMFKLCRAATTATLKVLG